SATIAEGEVVLGASPPARAGAAGSGAGRSGINGARAKPHASHGRRRKRRLSGPRFFLVQWCRTDVSVRFFLVAEGGLNGEGEGRHQWIRADRAELFPRVFRTRGRLRGGRR